LSEDRLKKSSDKKFELSKDRTLKMRLRYTKKEKGERLRKRELEFGNQKKDGTF